MSDSDRIEPGTDETLPQPPVESVRSGEPVGSGESAADQPTFMEDTSRLVEAESEELIPKFDGYRVLDELGRGGMGVVYKAIDLKLDRTVALKMIIGGRFASEVDVQRFRIEAESAARLDHPGIVPIYEIGEVGGNHFYSMKFIGGTSLSRCGKEVGSDAHAAARLVIKIAQAVQHAHERGVLHRDLKPANILIDESGQPWVTDLGLAKRMDDDGELTRTGLAMGTPGFMAPEQAQGRKDITTVADVFSLGAILFWLHTGEAPFKRETAMESLLATLEEEAPSLKSVFPNVDADLDLICRKALHRDPAQRYGSAAALASDLQSWINGDLLSVRAPTAVSVASVWIRKNLRVVLAACLAGLVCGVGVGTICMLDGLREAAAREFELKQLGHARATWVANFLPVRHIGNSLNVLQLLIVPLVAIAAFWNVLLVRPQSREANIVSAMTAALTSGVVAFLMGVGWQPMNALSIDRGSQDIELLANAVWLESDLEREIAQQVLIQRYPGMADLDQPGRQRLLFAKVKHDQQVGVIPGTWLGVGFAVLFVVLPMLATSILSGVAWLEGMRGWQWFGCTWERSVYCIIIFTIAAFWLMPIHPSLHVTLISLAIMAFALYVALTGRAWYWRVVIGFTPALCMTWLHYDMVTMRYSASAAGLAANDDELRAHTVNMNRLVQRNDDPFVHYKAGIASLSVGDETDYQEHCRRLLSNFENAFRPEIASRLAKLSLLRPDLQDPQDLPTFHKLAQLASGFESSGLRHWFYLTRALSEQRQGNADEALKWTPRSREATDPHGYMIAGSHLVDTLAHLDRGDTVAAEKSLRLGRAILQETRDMSYGDGHDVGWVDWRVFLILEKEAQTRLDAIRDAPESNSCEAG